VGSWANLDMILFAEVEKLVSDGLLIDFVLNLIEVATKFEVLGFFVVILVGIVFEQNVDLE
jgi:hypothetical protein